VLKFDATKRLNAIERLASPFERLSIEPPCPEMNAAWFASGRSILGIGHSQIVHITPDGRWHLSQTRDTLNFWRAGIDSTGLVYVASESTQVMYTLRPEDGVLQAQLGVEANEVLAIPTLPGAVVANRTSLSLFEGAREVWRTNELQWTGPRSMARSRDFVGGNFEQAGARGIKVLKASDGSLLERIRLQTGGPFAFAGNCLLVQDLGQSDWVTFRVLGSGVEAKLAHVRYSMGEGNLGRVAEDIAFVHGIVLVRSGGRLDAYRMPDECR
jgi:hypothetical protein